MTDSLWCVSGAEGFDTNVLAPLVPCTIVLTDCASLCLMCMSMSPSSALLPSFEGGSSTKIDYRKKGALIPTSLLEDLDVFPVFFSGWDICLLGSLAEDWLE